MKNERLFEALEKIDEELIDEAAPGNKPPKKKAKTATWVKWGAMAACVVVVVAIGIPKLSNMSDNSGATAGVEEEEAEGEGAPLAPVETDKDLESVSYIEVMSGFTGQKISVKDADSVQRVMNDIESLAYRKMEVAEEIEFAYRIRFYNENDDELGRIFITEENGHQICYDGYYYLVEADLNINVDYLEELLRDAPPAEPGDEGNDELPDREPAE
ncbi:MAG: hypothetical protein IJE43_05530 [Alphaproteobacteria bacterium]|nr:hypothetical protein [Alphaproteobacteria bacterium]